MSTRIPLALLLGLLGSAFASAQDRQRQAVPQSVFTVRGVQFSEDQQKKADDVQKKYTPNLSDLQRELNSVYTAAQRKAFQAALRAARDAGKDGRDSRQAADDAAKLSDEQKERRAAIQEKRTDLVAQIQQELRALLTDEQRVQLARNQRGQRNERRIASTRPNVKYGPHERNIMDVWLAKSDQPAPMLVSIECRVATGVRRGDDSFTKLTMAFIKKHLASRPW